MGFFAYLFGTGAPKNKISNVEHPLGKDEIFLLVSTAKIKTLDRKERDLIRELILKRRLGDGKISARQIDEVLAQAEHENLISKYDRQNVVRVIGEHFNKKFGNA